MMGNPLQVSAITYEARKPFTRRRNTDETTDSFCNQCFVTVATSRCESDLDRAEQTHVCDLYLVNYWKSLSEQSRYKRNDQS